MNTGTRPVTEKKLIADWDTLIRTFIRPENEASRNALFKYMEQILFGLNDFLQKHVGITEEMSLKDLAAWFQNTEITRNPEKKLEYVITDLIEGIAPLAVNVSSPYFIGHMTSAIPFFMVHLKTIVAALNQNVVKLETSKVFSVLEKQLLAKIHRMIYQNSRSFYQQHVQNPRTTLGCFTEDGTLANITALWVARNNLLAADKNFAGIENMGIHAAFQERDIDRCVVLVSRLGHYSLKKAGGVLGIGNRNVITVDVDRNNRIDLKDLQNKILTVRKEPKTRILAVVGIAGTTETGTIDPLQSLGEICARHDIHLHVDAAWGGPTLLSDKYAHLLKGIELADSVIIDGHKQFYMPMSLGMLFFKDPQLMEKIAYHANYVIRSGSVDMGSKSLSGSREANSLILDCALKIMGRQGYALLVEHGIELARQFADEIRKRTDFELVAEPELNILAYRLFPRHLKEKISIANNETRKKINFKLNRMNIKLQRLQREAGKSFVSRTTLTVNAEDIIVLRSVLMSPMTTIDILNEILDEQESIYHSKLK
ncbi:pyridoxal-dependent aspartate 1-decarboxylase PanP [Thermodesulfobacteriota bacterium]